jgi:hypothetical protein
LAPALIFYEFINFLKPRKTRMNRLTPESLNTLQSEMASFMAVRFMDDVPAGQPAAYPYHLMFCGGTGCRASKSMEIKHRLIEAIESRGHRDRIVLVETGCIGFCAHGPEGRALPLSIVVPKYQPQRATCLA